MGSEGRSARTEFAERFAELYEAAGNPTLQRVARAATDRMRAAAGPGARSASVQRISDWRSGRNVPARFATLLPVVLTLSEWAAARGAPVRSATEWERLWTAAVAAVPAETECPYLGLRSYRRTDADRFFGRDRAAAELADLVSSTAAARSGIVVLVGASGAGKSSLLAAGLAAVAAGPSDLFTPGADPVAALHNRPDGAALLLVDQGEELFTSCDDPARRDAFLAELDGIARAATSSVAVVLAMRADFFAVCLDHPILADALRHRAYLLDPMNADELADAITKPAGRVGVTLEPGLEELLIGELRGLGAYGDEGRGYDPGALPLLSHVLLTTWERHSGRKLAVADYRKAGGVRGSVAASAESAWGELDPVERDAARSLLLALVTVNPDHQDTRARLARTELLARADDPAAGEIALETLAAARLITLDADAVYLTHEIVLSAWPRLRAWISEDRVGALLRQRLTADAAEWDGAGQDPSLLYRGNRLATVTADATAAATESARRFLAAATDAEHRTRRRSHYIRAGLVLLSVVSLVLAGTAFVLRAGAAHQRDDAIYASVLAQADRLETLDPGESAQLDLVARHLRPHDPQVRDRLLAAANLPLSHTLPGHNGALSGVTFSPSGTLLASGDNDGNLRISSVADLRHPSWSSVTHVSDGPVDDPLFSPDGVLLVTTSDDDVRLWDIRHPDHPGLLSMLPVPKSSGAIGVSPDSRLVAVQSDPGLTVTFVDITDATKPQVIATQTVSSTPGSVQFSADWGSAVVWDVGSEAVRLCHVGDPRSGNPLTMGAMLPDTTGVAGISPRSDRLVVQNRVSKALQQWDIANLDNPTVLGAPTAPVSQVASYTYDTAERTLAITTVDGAIDVWNLDDPAGPHPIDSVLSTGTGNTLLLALSPDGAALAGDNIDGTVQLWSLPDTPLGGQDGEGLMPVFDAAGSVMATTTVAGDVQLWDTRAQGIPITRLARSGTGTNTESGYSAAMSADGRSLAVDSPANGTVDLYDISGRSLALPVARIPCGSTWPHPLFSPDSRLLYTQSLDEATRSVTLQVWDVHDLAHPSLLSHTRTDPGFSWVHTGAISADGHTMVLGGANAFASLFDVSDPVHPAALGTVSTGTDAKIWSAALRPDNRTLVLGGDDGTITVFDISNPRRPTMIAGPLQAHGKLVLSLNFSPDGRTLVCTSLDGKVLLWDFTDRKHPTTSGYSIAPPGVSPWWRAVFAPTGRLLAGAGETGALQLWDLDPAHAAARICDRSDRIDPQRWHELLPNLGYFRTC